MKSSPFGLAACDVSGKARFETRMFEPHEFDAYRVLMSHGLNFTVKAVDARARQRGKSSPDLVIEGTWWELKCPSGSNTQKTIARNINKAVRQMQNADPPVRDIKIVLSCLRTSLSKDNVLHHVKRKMQEKKISEVLVLVSETEVIRYAL